jgi:hypothetical protein
VDRGVGGPRHHLRNIKIAVDESAADYQDTERKAQQRFE